jgi:hypothetical protein
MGKGGLVGDVANVNLSGVWKLGEVYREKYDGTWVLPPTLIGTSSNNITSNVTSISLTKPAGTQSGDLVVVMLTGGSGDNDVGNWTNTDFTFLYENTTATQANSAIAYRVLNGTEGASFNFTITNSCKLSGELIVYRGASSIVTSSQNLQASGSPLIASSITASDNSILFAMFAQNADNSSFSSAPGDLTLLRTYSGGQKHSYWIGYKTVTTFGSTGNYQINSSSTNSSANFLFTIGYT